MKGDSSSYIVAHENFWRAEQNTLYPFTTSSEISCACHVKFDRGVFFDPVGFTDGSYIGTPINANILKLTGIAPNMPHSIATPVSKLSSISKLKTLKPF